MTSSSPPVDLSVGRATAQIDSNMTYWTGFKRWTDFFYCIPMKDGCSPFHVVNLYRKHIIFSRGRYHGNALKESVMSRFATVSKVLSLMVITEFNILYSPSIPGNHIRQALANKEISHLPFWTGIVLGCTVSKPSFLKK